MTVRRLQTHEEFAKDFVREMKKEVKTTLAMMANDDPKYVLQRRLAYGSVFFTLKNTAAKHGIPLADLGLVDYEVPNPRAEA